MTGDRRKPRREFRRLLDRRQRLERKQKRVLSDVFGIFTPDDCLSRAHYSRAVTGRKLIKRIEVAEYRRNDENFIRRLCAYLRHLAHDYALSYRDIGHR